MSETRDESSRLHIGTTWPPKGRARRTVLGIAAATAAAGTIMVLSVGGATATPTSPQGQTGQTVTVHVKQASLAQGCPNGEVATGAHFVITQIAAADAPDSITVFFSDNSQANSTGVQHHKHESGYDITFSAGLTITDATAVVPADWSGQFVLSHLICTGGTTSSAPASTPVTTPETTPVSTPVTTPVSTPVTTPVSTPVTTPVSTPVTTVETTPVETNSVSISASQTHSQSHSASGGQSHSNSSSVAATSAAPIPAGVNAGLHTPIANAGLKAWGIVLMVLGGAAGLLAGLWPTRRRAH